MMKLSNTPLSRFLWINMYGLTCAFLGVVVVDEPLLFALGFLVYFPVTATVAILNHDTDEDAYERGFKAAQKFYSVPQGGGGGGCDDDSKRFIDYCYRDVGVSMRFAEFKEDCERNDNDN